MRSQFLQGRMGAQWPHSYKKDHQQSLELVPPAENNNRNGAHPTHPKKIVPGAGEDEVPTTQI